MAFQQEIGEGRAWAVVTANQIVDMRPEDAVAACQQQAIAGMDILNATRTFADRKDLGAWHRYGRAISELCDGWLGMDADAIPEPHQDLSLLTGSNRVFGKRVAVNYRQDAPYPSTATNRLRVVRLALPEALRGLDKPSMSVKTGVRAIASTVEPISDRRATRPKKYGSLSRY